MYCSDRRKKKKKCLASNLYLALRLIISNGAQCLKVCSVVSPKHAMKAFFQNDISKAS